MKLFLAVFFVFFHAVADGICTAKDDVCKAGSGVCLPALSLVFTYNYTEAALTQKYGKYCGSTNICRAVGSSRYKIQKQLPTFIKQNYCIKRADKKKPKGCPPKPCDGLDAVCKRMTECQVRFDPDLDVFFKRNLTKELYCTCYVDYVHDMSVLATTTKPTGRCDSGFYKEPIDPNFSETGISLLKHEAVWLAGRRCCPILYLDDNENGIQDCVEDTLFTDQAKFNISYGFCKTLEDGLIALGLKACADWHTYGDC